MTTRYNPGNPSIKGFIHDNWNIIQHSYDCSNTFPDMPIIWFIRLTNLRDMLTKTSISYPPSNIYSPPQKSPKKLIPPKKTKTIHCTRLGTCKYCPLISKIHEITCKISGEIYQPKLTIKCIM